MSLTRYLLVIKALEELYALEALDDSGSLTPIGRRMAELPLDPNYAKLIINAKKYKCESRIIDIISMMSIDSPFYASQDEKDKQTMVLKEFKHFEGDHLTLLNVLIAFLKTPTQEFCDTHFIKKRSMAIVLQTRTQLRGLVKCGLEDEGSNDDVLKCILSGFFQNVGMLQGDGGYKIMGSPQPVYIHPSSHLFKQNAKCVVFGELVKTSRVYMKRVSVVRMEWVMEVAPHYYKKSTTIKINKN